MRTDFYINASKNWEYVLFNASNQHVHFLIFSTRALAKKDEDSDSSSSESNSSDEDGQIGPSVGLQGGEYDMKEEFAERQRRAEESKDVVPERESWMTELPSDRTGVKIGLGARIFTKREGTVSTKSFKTRIDGQHTTASRIIRTSIVASRLNLRFGSCPRGIPLRKDQLSVFFQDVVLDDSWTATPGQEKKAPKNDKKSEKSQQDLAQR